jgi:hypothetical protein
VYFDTLELVYRLTYNGDVVRRTPDQLSVFQALIIRLKKSRFKASLGQDRRFLLVGLRWRLRVLRGFATNRLLTGFSLSITACWKVIPTLSARTHWTLAAARLHFLTGMRESLFEC